MSPTLLDVSLGALALFLVNRVLVARKRSQQIAPFAPGPKGLPVIGNVLDMPAEKEWITFAEWGQKYGGIIHLNLMGQPMCIVNSAEIMSELDKKGALYSSRPTLQMGGELVGYNKTLVLIPYGARFRAYRKHIARLIGGPKEMSAYLPMEERECLRFLRAVLEEPSDVFGHLRKNAGSVILSLTYGITTTSTPTTSDPFVSLIEDANNNFNAATVPGAFLVDYFPVLNKIPEWCFWKGGFKRIARGWRKSTMAMVEVPYAYTKAQIEAGTAPHSFVSDLLENEKSMDVEEIDIVQFTAASLYGGGADTTVSAQYAFFLAMVLNPHVLKKAQAEIDAVVGRDRLPGFADREQLPYVMAIVTEVLRWNSVAPTGVPHTATEDGVIAGYFIPKNTIILANLWGMLHDPEVYPDPFTFDPTRHIATPEKPAQPDPRSICFGYGRRVCPGQTLAEASLYIVVVQSLAVFDISTVNGEDGLPVIPVHENSSGIISYPKPFKFTIKPRSEKAVALIAEERV